MVTVMTDDSVVLASGRVISAEEFNADFDLVEAGGFPGTGGVTVHGPLTPPNRRGLRQGGVSLSSDGEHSPTVGVVLPREIHDKVKARAAAERMSVSKWMRRLAEREVA